jgi:hypothetical protein
MTVVHNTMANYYTAFHMLKYVVSMLSRNENLESEVIYLLTFMNLGRLSKI